MAKNKEEKEGQARALNSDFKREIVKDSGENVTCDGRDVSSGSSLSQLEISDGWKKRIREKTKEMCHNPVKLGR